MERSWGSMVVQLLLFFLHSLSSLGQSPYQRAMALQGRRAWTPNYCNNSRLMEEMGLAKTALGAFIGYPCDPNYFACSWAKDGWRSFRRQCAVGQIFDPSGIQNCTFKDNVPACAQEKEAVCSDLCIAEEFEFECCLSEECVAAGKRCDGNMDCTFEEDEKNCAHCKPGEMPCAKADTPTCVSLSQRCDDTPDCPDGSDERFCDECENNNFYCLGSKRCVDQAARCDGERDCTYGEDEVYCCMLCFNSAPSLETPLQEFCVQGNRILSTARMPIIPRLTWI